MSADDMEKMICDDEIKKKKKKYLMKFDNLCLSKGKLDLCFMFLLILSVIIIIMYLFIIPFLSFKATEKKLPIIENSLNNHSELFFNSANDVDNYFNLIYKKITHETDEKINILEKEFHKINDKLNDNDLKLKETHRKLNDATCSLIPEDKRFDCHPEAGATEISCTQRNCCWKPVHKTKQNFIDIPYCFYGINWQIYKYENITIHKNENDISGFLKSTSKSSYKNDLSLIKIESTSVDESILRVKLYDPLKKRYEPPWPIRNETNSFLGTTMYNIKIDKTSPGFSVHRNLNGETLFNSNGIGGFIFANQFLQMSSLLPSSNIYGLGEHRRNLKLSTNWELLTLFNSDRPPTENANLYGSHPFYMIIEKSGDCHGVLFLNSNAMDIILQPAPAITFRTIGGIFDIYFFMGPTPNDVLQQYAMIVGKPFFPPYWSLGFHLCRFGYGSLEKTKETWNRTRVAGIPFDTQWNDLDYMDRHNDFTYDKIKFKELPEFIKNLHNEGMHYIPLIDAGISGTEINGSYIPYDEGVREGIFVKDNNGSPFQGKVWNFNSTVWPDFTNPKTQDYYLKMMKETHDNFQFDGAWIDMNEPSNFYNGLSNGCPINNLDNPEYVPQVNGGILATKTLCMNSQHYLGSHYDLHNTYGISQAISTNNALKQIRNKRPFIISRSTWVGHGFYAGHWTGDIYSSWYDLKMSIPEILQFSFFQIPMVGADICGFNGNTTVSLCNRWMQVGAFYPFSRNHNSDDTIEQDPAVMGELVIRSSKKALTIRYELLPYLYTLFSAAHRFGVTVARPLFFEFTNDPATYNIDTQFLWGSSLMIVPVLDEISDKNEKVDAYIPAGKWYNFYTNESILSTGENVTLNAPLDTIPLLVRGGSILPMQQSSRTTTESRKNKFALLIALDNQQYATGELYWDDGESLDSIEKDEYHWLNFTVSNNTLRVHSIMGSFSEKIILGRIKVMGLDLEKVSRVIVNDKDIDTDQFYYNKNPSYLFVQNLNLEMKDMLTLSWTEKEKEITKVMIERYRGPVVHSAAVTFTSYNIFLISIISILLINRLMFQKMIKHKWIKILVTLILIVEYSEQTLIKKNYEINDENKNIEDSTCSLIMDNERFDCHPEDGASELACGSRNCCWKFSDNIKIPSCYYRKNWKIYNYGDINTQRENKNNILAFLKLHERSTYKNDLPLVAIESTSIDAYTLRVKLFDPSQKRYEPPWPIKSKLEPFDGSTSYKLKINESAPGFSVHRKSNNITLFDSNGIGGFIFANQFLQMSSLLPSHNIYGLGQHRTHLKLSTNWQLLTFFSADQPVTENANLYGSQPFYFVIEKSGDCHGVLFLNSNAMDIILQPTPAITFRTIGGIFDIYFFMGPTPEDVLKQYANFIGNPFLPPYWSLGFHLSRLGYHTLEGTKKVWNRTKMAKIPFDTQWNDLDYMERRNDFTYDRKRFKGLPEFIKELHDGGMHYIPLIDAGISGTEKKGSYPPLDEGLRRGIFIKENGTNLPFYGKVWNPITTVWPDFTNPKTKEYYKEMMQRAHKNFQFDGAWIDMNEPSSFINGHFDGCPQNDLDNPQFVPHVAGRQLSRKTLCMNANQFLGYHYDLHNTYGIGQAAATNYALSKIRKKRPFIITRSTWIGIGFYAGAWTGDAYSSWHSLRMSIPEILSYTFYQIPMVGVDICGFDGDTTEALCNRWVQVGAFYPFARNHNSDDTIEQDPVSMGELVVNSTRKSLMTRYELLPYLYTLFFRAHKFGETVARPLFFEFLIKSKKLNVTFQMENGIIIIHLNN
ncbi:maltase-glucoamylase-like isoform X2 [Leptopilina boulardi]|uniref:maltase-glucoamylase-like isoform X2 n=1 Tax=Leptopilina boulardi TaxID=63433 RepID=UPI0021F5C339|nr:maltase-glucoamylase-like isoform X2 [Leptopilina boulardi]